MKEGIRREILNYSSEDVESCERGVLSASLQNKIKGDLKAKYYIGIFGIIVINGLWVSLYSNRDTFIEQAMPPFLLYGMIIFMAIFGVFIMSKVIQSKGILANIPNERILAMDVTTSEIKHDYSGSRGGTSHFLLIRDLKFFIHIRKLESVNTLFDTDVAYRIWYGEKSEVLLAIKELN